MESNPNAQRVLFGAIQSRLLARVNARINNGDFTERGLARLLGISQPQLHNVLKGARKLKPELADRLMTKFNIGILDLLHATELRLQLLHQAMELNGEACSACPLQNGLADGAKPDNLSVIRKLPSRSIPPLGLKSTG